MAGLALCATTADARVVAPSGVTDLSVGPGTGQVSPVTPTGGYAAALPIGLPAPRGRFTPPLTVQYTASAQTGAAGSGWDIPLTYVRRSASPWHRKPTVSVDATGHAFVPERIVLSLGGASTLMMPSATADVWVPFLGDEYMELRRTSVGWTLATASGVQYDFVPVAQVGDRGLVDPDLWLLTAVRDTVGGDHLELRYDTTDRGCGHELDLAGMSYTYDLAGRALYDVELAYAPQQVTTWSAEGACGANVGAGPWPARLALTDADGYQVPRSRILQQIVVRARNNLDPAAPAHAIQRIALGYTPDPDTGLPRLTSADLSGEETSTTPALPLARYAYGALTSATDDHVYLGARAPLPIPAAAVAAGVAGLAGSSRTHRTEGNGTAVDTVRTDYLIRDFTGDAVPDLVYRDGSRWVLQQGVATAAGPSFVTGPTTSWAYPAGPAELFVEETRQYEPADIAAKRAAMVTTATMTEFVDWNGDGRLDVVDAAGGSSLYTWRVWLNRADGASILRFDPIEVNVSAFVDLLNGRGIALDPTGPGVPSRLPIERSRSWPTYERYECLEASEVSADPTGAIVACSAIDQVERSSQTVTEWTLADLNGDSFPDLAAGNPVRECEVAAEITPSSDEPSHLFDAGGRLLDSSHYLYFATHIAPTGDCAGGATNWVSVLLNRAGVLATAVVQNPEPWWISTSGGLSTWSTEDSDGGPFEPGWSRHLDGFADVHGLGMPHRAHPPEAFAFSDGCDTGSVSTQTVGLVDLNGDGTPDEVDRHGPGWVVRFGTSAGFGAAHPIDFDTFGAHLFHLSRSARCGDETTTTVGLLDLDGDGRPELVAADATTGALSYAALATPDGAPATASVGRLVAVDNGHGAVTRIEYASNKAESGTTHQVPAPEIVVSRTYVDVTDGSAPDSAPVLFAYGQPDLRFDPAFERIGFVGYRRTVTLIGGQRTTVATITDRSPPARPDEDFAAYARAGRVVRVSRLESVAAASPGALLGVRTPNDGAIDARVRAQHESSYGVTELPLARYSGAYFDFLDVDVDHGLYDQLRWHAAVVHGSTESSWEGMHAPTATDNVVTATAVSEVDERGRPTLVTSFGDMRTLADDTCTTIDYAAAPAPLSVVAGVHVDDCGATAAFGGTPRVIAGTRYTYDDLPEGQASRGRLSSQIVETYDVSDGSLLDERVAMTLSYGPLGQVKTITAKRTVGGAATRTTTLDRDPFGVTTARRTVTASDVPAGPFVETEQRSTWPSVPVVTVGLNGERTETSRDAFGRTTKTNLVAGATTHTALARAYLDGPLGREVVETTYPATAALPQRRHLHLDALGRPRFTQVELGADYGGRTLVRGLVEYDALGRAVYEAAPFEAAALPFVPESLPADRTMWPYGTTRVFDGAGRLVRVVEAPGERPSATSSAVGADTYVSTVAYGWDSGRAVTTTAGPRDNDPAAAAYLAVNQAFTTATGWPVEDRRVDRTGTVLDRVRRDFDRLGMLAHLRRFRDPAAATGAVEWATVHDSAGRTLSMQEPGESLVESDYDDWGELVATRWTDAGRLRVQSHAYDGLGRETSSTLTTRDLATGFVTVEDDQRLLYDVHSGSPFQDPGAFVGRLSRVTARGVGDALVSYDAFGRTTADAYYYPAHGRAMKTRRVYAAGGALTELDYDTSAGVDRIGYALDSAGRTRRVTDLAGGAVLFDATQVDAKGRYRTVKLGNGVAEYADYAADGREELVRQTVKTPAGSRNHDLLGRDADGRLLTEMWGGQSSPSAVYDYDLLGRLTRSVQAGQDERFTYDGLGNLRTRRNAADVASDRDNIPDVADLDRLCAQVPAGGANWGVCTFGYDAAGNVVRDASSSTTRTFTYDAASRVTAVTRGTWRAAFVYGPGGGLARTDVWNGTSLNRRTWAFGDLVEERTRPDGHTEVDRRVVGPEGLVATLRSDGAVRETVYVHGDGRANRLFTRADAAIAQDVRYRAYGGVLQDTGSAASLTTSDDLWNGGDDLRDLGVDLLGARLYDPALGRFLQRDPLVAGASSSGGHPYAFAFGDPVNFADPSGLSSCESQLPCDFATAAISGGIALGAWAISSWSGSDDAVVSEISFAIPGLDEAVAWTGSKWLSVNGAMGIGFGRGVIDMGKGLLDRGQRCIDNYGFCSAHDVEDFVDNLGAQGRATMDPGGTLKAAGRGDVFEGMGYFGAQFVVGELGGMAVASLGARFAARAAARSAEFSEAAARMIGLTEDELRAVWGAGPDGAAPVGEVDPRTIRFTQDSISRKFSSGTTLGETIEGLKGGTLAPEAFPPIRVFDREGVTFTLDNRRLFVFQEAGKTIRTVPATPREVAAESWKFTTRNNGVSIRIRGGS